MFNCFPLFNLIYKHLGAVFFFFVHSQAQVMTKKEAEL